MKAHSKKVVHIEPNWAADLAAAIGPKTPVGHPGPGWVTVIEFSRECALSVSQAKARLEAAARAGKISKETRRLKGRTVNFYKLK